MNSYRDPELDDVMQDDELRHIAAVLSSTRAPEPPVDDVVAPRIRASGPGLGRRARRASADRFGRRLHVEPATGRPIPAQRDQPGRWQPSRGPAAADPRPLQPGDGSLDDRGRCPGDAGNHGRLQLDREHAVGPADHGQPRAEHSIPGDDRPRSEDILRATAGEAADDHLRDAAAGHADAGPNPPAHTFERPRRKAARRDERGHVAERPVVGRFVVDLLRGRQGRARRGAGEGRPGECHRA